ncbi:suppressor of fused domain protein [Kribbella sp. NPDC051620]|uniref:suppressor of fused domain protein n=1 Tax=Kribbella sp. NPDC051620 TaxID=3364120 RepID=UPI00379C6E32
MTVVSAVRDLYRGRWGEPSRKAAFRSGAFEIEIFKWDAAANGEGVDLYATLGASVEDMPGAGDGHRVEYFVGLQPGRDAIASPLAALGLFARREGVRVDHGHTVPADEALWPGSEMHTLLVLRQAVEILPELRLEDGVRVEFLQVVPVFESERMFVAEHGADTLLKRWEGAATPFWDPRRAAEPA